MNNYTILTLTCIISTILLSTTVSGREIKPKYAQAFCGDAFIRAWKLVCKIKELREHRRGRSISGMVSSVYEVTKLFLWCMQFKGGACSLFTFNR